jgi:serine/threonine protein kinase/tetratricopeptide (TPR) repeat protein
VAASGRISVRVTRGVLDAPDASLQQESVTQPSRPDLDIAGYTILRKIDEGGMGEVFEASQEEPARRVAIKLVKRGMDSEEVVARFESERQALALMNHACIAQVYAAGTTGTGRPYFVMEYVEGVPITEHCDRERLGIDERIALFLQVCEGVHHAHQKGIIHRDIKSSNVLVHVDDGRASPKIIDFGLAKALSRKTEEVGLTQAGTPIGTPEYMSPEQLELEGTSVDTRTDVYALGVLLFELLVGSRPFDARVMIEEGFFEFRRQILEVDAPRPSSRATEDTAVLRRTNALQLGRWLRGDLDWIVGHALEKLPDRRYPSVSEFAADLQRYLDDEPVLASPPSRVYRIQKFVRRHKLGVASALALLVALGLGIVGTSLALVRAVRAEELASREAERANQEALTARKAEELASREAERANQEAHTARRTAGFLTGLFEVVDPGEARGNTVTAREILDRGAKRIDSELREQPEVRASLMGTMGVVYSRLGLYQAALPLLRGALEERQRILGDEDERVAESRNDLGETLRLAADFENAEHELRAALEVRRRLLGDHPAVAQSLHDLGTVLADLGRHAEAEALLREALELRRRLLGRHADVAASLNELAFALYDQQETEGVEEMLREALDMRTGLLGKHPATAESLSNLGAFLYEQDRKKEAIPFWRRSLDMKRELFGAVHPDVAMTLNNLALTLQDAGDLDGAEELFRSAVEQQRTLLGDSHPSLGLALGNLAFVFRDRGDYEGARATFFESVAVYRRALGEEHASAVGAVSNAKQLVTMEIERRVRQLGEESPEVAAARLDLAELYRIAGRPAEARPLAEEAWLFFSEGAGAAAGGALLARAQSEFGATLADLGELDEGEELLGIGFAGLLAALGPAARETREAGERLAVLLELRGRPEEASGVRRRLGAVGKGG